MVFVYGTLKRGGKFSSLLADAECLGELCTPRRYRLFDLGPWPVAMPPGAGQRKGTALHGEVVRVDRRILARLDRLEGSAYRRERLSTPWGPAWIYLSRHFSPTSQSSSAVRGAPKNKTSRRGRMLPHGVWPPGSRTSNRKAGVCS